MADALYYTTHASVIGKLLIVASNRGVRYVRLLTDGEDAAAHVAKEFSTPPQPSLFELDGFFATTTAAIDRYLAGKGDPLKLPFDLVGGTPLQRMVWLAIAKVPFGETISYTVLAEKVGFPRAVRAVASACGANPVPLVIPCHRIVAKDGTLGGFSLGGLGVKEKLLGLEQKKEALAAA